jgi:predicted DNA-binding antitoxin AbrB/MazE fold protein
MSEVFEAIYEKGVLRPATPMVGISEGQRVWVTINDSEHSAAIRAGIDDMEAGRVEAFDDVDARIRANLGLSRRP